MTSEDARKSIELIAKLFNFEIAVTRERLPTCEQFIGLDCPPFKQLTPVDYGEYRIHFNRNDIKKLDNYPSEEFEAFGRRVYAIDFDYNSALGDGECLEDAMLRACVKLSGATLYGFSDKANDKTGYLPTLLGQVDKCRVVLGTVPEFSSYAELRVKLALRGDFVQWM